MKSTIETNMKSIYFNKNILDHLTCRIIILNLIFKIIRDKSVEKKKRKCRQTKK